MNRTPPKRRSNQRRTPRPDQRTPGDIWRTPRPLPELLPIEATREPGALLASLGQPPLPGDIDVSQYLIAVVERSAGLATLLAQSVDLLAKPTD